MFPTGIFNRHFHDIESTVIKDTWQDYKQKAAFSGMISTVFVFHCVFILFSFKLIDSLRRPPVWRMPI